MSEKIVKKVAKKSETSGAKIRVVQKASTIGRPVKQRQTLLGLGLKKIGGSKILEDTPSVRGMINKVKHLVDFKAV